MRGEMTKLGMFLCLLLSSQIWAGDWQRVKSGIPVSAYKIGRDTNGKVLYACQVSFRNSLPMLLNNTAKTFVFIC